jgi:NADPH:quinone reductase-like Zn-dependent oxidoreductase
MKAIIKAERGPGVTMTEVQMPEAGPNDVLIKIKKNSDLRH